MDHLSKTFKSVQRGVAALRVTVSGHAVRLDDIDVRLDGTASRVDTVEGSCLFASRHRICSTSSCFRRCVVLTVCRGVVTGTVLQLSTALTSLRSQLHALRGTAASASDVSRLVAEVEKLSAQVCCVSAVRIAGGGSSP